MPAFTPATVIVQPGKLEGSGPATVGGNKICVDGDESKVSVAGCAAAARADNAQIAAVLKAQGTVKLKPGA
jgi:hypothetical protein